MEVDGIGGSGSSATQTGAGVTVRGPQWLTGVGVFPKPQRRQAPTLTPPPTLSLLQSLKLEQRAGSWQAVLLTISQQRCPRIPAASVLASTDGQQGLQEVPGGVTLNGLVERLVVFLDELPPDVEQVDLTP